MSVKVLDTVSGSTFTFPMLPEKISFTCAAKFIEYELMTSGDASIPNGEEVSECSWDGILPGESRNNLSYVNDWKNPREIQGLWSIWRTSGRKLRLTIDDTPINHDVYLAKYEIEYSGGHGDYKYNIKFVAAKDIVISVEAKVKDDTSTEEKKTTTTKADTKQYVTVTGSKVNIRAKASTSGKIVKVSKKGDKFEYGGKKSGNWYCIVVDGTKRWISTKYSKLSSSSKTSKSSSGSSSSSKTYTVKKGDTLWAIAKKYYGDGSKYTKIKTANGLKSNTIVIGQKLKIP